MAGPQDNFVVKMRIGKSDPTAPVPGDVDVDVTANVQAISISRGRDRETDNFTPGTCTVTLLDTDRRYDPNNKGRIGWINFTGQTGTFDSTPDAADLDVAGDLSFLVRINNLQTSAATRTIVSKWTATGNQRSYSLSLTTTNAVQFEWTTDGSTVQSLTTTESLPTGSDDLWFVAYHRVDNGSGENQLIVLSQTDTELAWQGVFDLLDIVTVSGTTSHFASTAGLLISGRNAGGEQPMDGGGVIQVDVHAGAYPHGTNVARRRYITEEQQTSPVTDIKTWTITGTDFTFADNGGSPYAAALTAVRNVMIDYDDGIVTDVFTGHVDDWRVDYAEGDTLSTVTVTCSDSMGLLANQELDTIAAAHGGETSGARINTVLARSEVNFTEPKAIDAGLSTFGATTFGANALDYIQQCAKGEVGYLFVGGGGTLTFLDRHTALDVDAAATFSDEHSAGGIKYRLATQLSSTDLLYNRATGAGTSGTEQTAADTDSQDDYGVRTLPVGDLLNQQDSEVLDLLTYLVQRFKDPESRFSEIEINTAGRTGTEAKLIAGLNVADVVAVKRTPLGLADTIEKTSIIEGVTHDVTAGSWVTRLRLSNADTRPFLILDDATFGELDANRLAF